jgi:hypothetical protein
MMMPSWYVECPIGCSAQPTLHEYAEANKLTFIGLEGTQVVWVTNEADTEFAMCCYYKKNFCNFCIQKPAKRGHLATTLIQHVHKFSTCVVCGCCVPLAITRNCTVKTRKFTCSPRCTEILDTQASELDRQAKGLKELLDTQASDLERQTIDLKLREEAIMLKFMLQGEALNRRGDELRLQQQQLDKAQEQQAINFNKAQEQQAKNLAISCLGKRSKLRGVQFSNTM